MASPQLSATSKSPAGTSQFASSSASPASKATSFQSFYPPSPPAIDRRSFDRYSPAESGGLSLDGRPYLYPTVALRRLAPAMSHEALTSMLLFAEDFIDATFTEGFDEQGFQTAIARFRTFEGAFEVKRRLHGKPNSTSEATMIVDLLQEPTNDLGSNLHRTLSDAKPLPSASLARGLSLNSHATRPHSRYFQSMGDKLHAANASVESELTNGDLKPNGSSFFPGTASTPIGANRVTGKSIINDDADDETGELLRDPVAYARNGRAHIIKRKPANVQPPVTRLANLSLHSASSNGIHPNQMISPPNTSYGVPRANQMLESNAATDLGGSVPPLSPTGSFPVNANSIHRHHFPPANPADQNPPCNTLYVGNLPIDTSEDELKAVFSKQRGYKRLCFRTKHNGPMCFVEFEDVSFATKALNELYGHPLHNSVKGGIRLSFSKNPLGVRTGQSNNATSMNSISPNTGAGLGLMGCPPGFSTANGPPPGLSAPPGLRSPIGSNLIGSSAYQNGFGGFSAIASSPSLGITSSTNSPRVPLGAFGNDNAFMQANSHYQDFMAGR